MFLANASRFSAKPSPAGYAAEKFTSHRQPKYPSATGIPLNFKLKKAVFCTKIG